MSPHCCFLYRHAVQLVRLPHYSDVTMGTMASQTISLTIVNSTVYPGGDQRKQQSSASLAFVRGIHRSPVNSPHKRPVTRKWFHLMTSSCSLAIVQVRYGLTIWCACWLTVVCPFVTTEGGVIYCIYDCSHGEDMGVVRYSWTNVNSI